MLGVGKSAAWQWLIAGKHPAARDFFTVGKQTPMTEALANWIRRGAEQLAGSKERLSASCSWRFWFQTPKRGIITCGLVRNSCDSVGRLYPLLLMGSGSLNDWEDNWELLPVTCEGLWGQMEQLTARNYNTLKRLEADLTTLRPPRPSWQGITPAKVIPEDKQKLCEFVAEHLRSFEAEQAIFLPLANGNSADLFEVISYLHLLFKERISEVPNAGFLGGPLEQPALALFKRPLNIHDFKRMWVPQCL